MIELLQNKKPDEMFHLDLLNVLATWELQESYPNIERALKTFLIMPTTVATAKRSFSKLKIIKNYARSTLRSTTRIISSSSFHRTWTYQSNKLR